MSGSNVERFGHTADGDEVRRVTIEDGLRVSVLTFGAVVQRLEAPDRTGRRDNLVLGLESVADYATRSPHFGAVAGRYAGRIGGGRFTLDGTAHVLAQNEGANTLHGGPGGFGRRNWTLERVDRRTATLALVSADGEEGFPGTVRVEVTYTVEGGTLRIDYAAMTDRATVLNLTNHSYFNLAGEGSGDVFGHVLQVEADSFLEQDSASLPTGRVLPVAGTPFDFRAPRPIGARIREADPQILLGLGYDQCLVLRGSGLRRAAVVREAGSGRVLEVWTDQPGLQLYTGNKLTGALHGPSGRTYRSGDGLCLETQHFPDSPNQAGFPSTVLRPGERFRSRTSYAFFA